LYLPKPAGLIQAVFLQGPKMKQWLTDKKQTVLGKYRSVIREKAIDQAKVEIALAGKEVSDYTAEQLEIIVKDQED